uniref:Uncharacterized protein n=2 Tax=Phaeomonas parva TaxID=124430 RepID=A0A7S1TU54_9STRA|mmetsp:Transcript_17985/g.55045  ORF Transcript_17985/g.55045 Transcript_17985/m.55045 type:complete len:271 (+) Transcript_17985:200-1012(+)
MLNRHGPLKPNEVKALQQGLTEAAKAGGHNRDDSNLSDLSLSNIAQSPVAATQKKEPRHLKKFKILMLGDSAVGKTSLINRFVEDKFAHNLVGTVGVDFKMKRMWLGPTKEMCTVQIWDTAGQERFHRITKTYYRGANAIYLTFDCSSQDSLDNLEYWVQNIKDNASDDVLVLLAANKIDLRETESPDKATEISGIVRRGQDIASQYGIEYFETSAKTGDGVEASFTRLADIAFEKLSREAGAEGGAASSAAGTPGSDGKKKGKKDCVIQ